jgi:putative ABC transport system permease protein
MTAGSGRWSNGIGVAGLARLLTRPYVLRHPFPTFCIAAGVTLAVAGYAAMHLADHAIRESFRAATDQLAGSAHLQITAGDAGVPEEILATAEQSPCVAAAAALMLRVVRTGSQSENTIALIGVDLLVEPQFREHHLAGRPAFDDALVFLAQPDSVMLTREFAARNGLPIGSQIEVWTGEQRRALRVRGLFDGDGVARAYDGNAGLMDVYAAQHVFGRRGFFDRIDIRVADGEDVERCRTTLQAAAGSYVTVDTPASRGRSVEMFSNTYLLLVRSTGLIGALIAMFLVGQAAAVSVAEREKSIAIVLGLGADERAVQRLVMIEQAALGFAGSTAGILLGAVAARMLSPVLLQLLHQSGRGAPDLSYPMPQWPWIAGTIAAAMLLCALAAIGPARRAAQVPPIQLAEAARYSGVVEPRRTWRTLAAAACFPAAILWQYLDPRLEIVGIALPLAAAGLCATGLLLAKPAMKISGRLFARVWPLEGSLLSGGWERGVRRARAALLGIAATTAALMAISGATAAYARGLGNWIQELVSADFIVHSGHHIARNGDLLPIALRGRLESLKDVSNAIPVRRFFGRAAGVRAKLIATDLAASGKPPDRAVISRNLANRRGLRSGDSIEIDSPGGPFTLLIGEVIDDYASEAGSVYFDWALYRTRFQTEAVELYSVHARPGFGREALRSGISQQIGDAPALVLDGRELRAQFTGVVGRWRALSAVQAGVALGLSLIAAAGFLAVSLRSRRRDFGILDVLGSTPAQVIRSIAAEALVIAAAGLLAGVVLGVLLHGYLLFTLRNSVNGYELPWVIDFRTMAALVVVLPIGALAAAAPAAAGLLRANLAMELSSDG